MVTCSLPLTPKRGRWVATVSSSESCPRSTSCITAVAVNSLEMEARS